MKREKNEWVHHPRQQKEKWFGLVVLCWRMGNNEAQDICIGLLNRGEPWWVIRAESNRHWWTRSPSFFYVYIYAIWRTRSVLPTSWHSHTCFQWDRNLLFFPPFRHRRMRPNSLNRVDITRPAPTLPIGLYSGTQRCPSEVHHELLLDLLCPFVKRGYESYCPALLFLSDDAPTTSLYYTRKYLRNTLKRMMGTRRIQKDGSLSFCTTFEWWRSSAAKLFWKIFRQLFHALASFR